MPLIVLSCAARICLVCLRNSLETRIAVSSVPFERLELNPAVYSYIAVPLHVTFRSTYKAPELDHGMVIHNERSYSLVPCASTHRYTRPFMAKASHVLGSFAGFHVGAMCVGEFATSGI